MASSMSAIGGASGASTLVSSAKDLATMSSVISSSVSSVSSSVIGASEADGGVIGLFGLDPIDDKCEFHAAVLSV